MKTLRWLAIAVMVSMLFFPGVVMAQPEATPELTTEGVLIDALLAMTLSEGALPASPQQVYYYRYVVPAGSAATYPAGYSPPDLIVRHVEQGALLLRPRAESYVWRGAGAGDPIALPAHEAVTIGAGDTILTPRVPYAADGQDALGELSNPGSTDASVVGFYLRGAERCCPSAGHPPIMTTWMSYTTEWPIAPVPLTFAVLRITLAAGAEWTPELADGMVFIAVEKGEIQTEYLKEDGTTGTRGWYEHKVYNNVASDPVVTVRNPGVEAVELTILTVSPVAPGATPLI